MLDYNTVPIDDIDTFIQWLDDLFPDKCPDIKHSEREIWINVGRHQAAQTIISKLSHMQKRGLEGE